MVKQKFNSFNIFVINGDTLFWSVPVFNDNTKTTNNLRALQQQE